MKESIVDTKRFTVDWSMISWEWGRKWRKLTKPFWKTAERLNRPSRYVLKKAWTMEPWDWAYQMYLEQAGLRKMLAYFEKHHIVEGAEQIERDLRICTRLIDIFNEQEELRVWDGMRLTDKLNRHVNVKNASRFMSKERAECLSRFAGGQEEIYRIKAQYLYHKIRFERERTWWD